MNQTCNYAVSIRIGHGSVFHNPANRVTYSVARVYLEPTVEIATLR